MSALLLDPGEKMRLERDLTLTDEAPRQELQEDRSPNDFDMMLEGLMLALKARLQ